MEGTTKEKEMLTGCYSIDAYCDYHKALEDIDPVSGIGRYRPHPHQAVGETNGQCRKALRKMGWVLGPVWHKCPECVAEKRTEVVGEMRF